MSHYPSSAELAAFRRSSYHPHAVDYRPIPYPLTPPNDAGAYPHERRIGIGYRAIQPEPLPSKGPIPARYVSDSRREASALRSRAYWAADCPNGWGLFASYAERVGGIPYWDDPIVSTDTWTEEEPRSPLPIRYQPSFTIG